ncbi:hypothetical protein AYR66_17295 [Noviherbaspirillum denitrificans]|uniref:Aspartate carbamoyltransferase regulatory subunit C-terminal domain-containing protein n=1 Tax=Noviherbaspirillum denitrificans TaxID=1968433 RepID=A0A254TE82_9BURK|nr:hypothetical protein AYR66_17295 [Noviherbaspirillum denitrificans]
MAIRLERCPNPECTRQYILEQFSSAFGDKKERGRIRCPYCGGSREGNAASAYRSRPLPAHFEEWTDLYLS